MRMPVSSSWALYCLFSLCVSVVHADEDNVDWPHTGGDIAHTRYSPLNQINKSNVANLEIVWKWESADTPIAKTESVLRRSQNQAQPIMVGGTLYATTASSQLAALDPESGEQKWVFNPESYKKGPPTTARGYLHRGQSYWTDGDEERLLFVSAVGELYSVDAKTGKPDPDFGSGGQVDLKQFLSRKKTASTISGTSPPLVIGDIVIPSYWMSDQSAYKEMPPGDVWGFDVRTGERLWTFHTIPRDGEFGADTWEGDSRSYTGNANPWAPISGDEELGYIYIPVSMPTNLWYGGHRRGDNLFGNSLVCLNAKTGERVWHFQMIHHDIWDYDVSAAPILCDITVDGKKRKVVAQVTKQAFCYVLDRVTGKPIWPIEERPVPTSDTPGERASSTQPFPTRPAAFDLQGFSRDDVISLTPELREEALKIIEERKIDFVSMFQPATAKGVMQMPGFAGGANWGGAAFDSDTGMFYIPSFTYPTSIAMAKPDPARANSAYVMRNGLQFDGPQGLPLYDPPYARITAIDLNTGDHVWMTPNGAGPRDHPALKNLDLGPLGSTTRTGILLTNELVFTVGLGYVLGDGDTDQPMLYAYDKTNGALLAEIEIPHRGLPGPITYSVNGRQYIALGTGYLNQPQHIVALALKSE
ncbi:MAG: pyrroloquinoline quinone-dependent dehydrogenase [Candidatus Hydrogenedentota bacterium]